jgi:cytochrome c
MRKMKGIIVAFLLLCLTVTFVYAQERGTQAEAKALLKKAVELIKAEGPDKAYPQLQDPKGKFVVKDLYIYIATLDKGVVKVHPFMPVMIGQSWLTLKDADGKAFVKELVEGGKTNGSGTVDYRWMNPKTKKVDNKSAFYQRVGDIVVVCGFYK